MCYDNYDLIIVLSDLVVGGGATLLAEGSPLFLVCQDRSGQIRADSLFYDMPVR